MKCLCSNFIFFQELLVQIGTSTFWVQVFLFPKYIQEALSVFGNDIEWETDNIKILLKKFWKGLKDNYNED